jgi:LmbE family N-acetylglucosaminyl deacetylase
MMMLSVEKFFLAVLFIFNYVLANDWVATDTPLFPDTGSIARKQAIIDINGGCRVLSIVSAPGYEDMATLSYLRLAKGAVITCVYLTNGEEIPNDLGKDSFQETAIRRKEEAFNAIKLLGGETYFFNIAADKFWNAGVKNDFSIIKEQFFNSCQKVLEEVKPDLVLLNSDYTFGKDNQRATSFLKKELMEIAGKLRKNKSVYINRIAVEDDRAAVPAVTATAKDQLRGKTYQEIGDKILTTYKSLQYHLPLWSSFAPRAYDIIFQGSSKRVSTIDGGLPARSWRIKSLYTQIQKSIESKTGNVLQHTTEAIDMVDSYIASHPLRLSNEEQKDILYLKEKLENFRCTLLDVAVHVSADDNFVNPIQLFFLKVDVPKKWLTKGKTMLMFPNAAGDDWIINERRDQFYDLHSDTTLKILTPKKLSLTDPLTYEGFISNHVSLPFTVMVVHKDPDRTHNFIYQRDIPLIVTQRSILEVLTPTIAAFRDTTVVIRVTNNTFDKLKSSLFVEDSAVSAPPRSIFMNKKGDHIVDTLFLQWSKNLSFGDRSIPIKIHNGTPVADFLCKNFDVNISDRPRSVGIISNIRDNTLTAALGRLNLKPLKIDSVDSLKPTLSSLSVIFVDEFSSPTITRSPGGSETIMRWVSAGGRLIVFSQYPTEHFPDDSVKFIFQNTTYSENDVEEKDDSLLMYPNQFSHTDWQGWFFAFAFGGIDFHQSPAVKPIVLSKEKQVPLVVIRNFGKGEIIYSTLNIGTQLCNVQLGAYKMLANMAAVKE